MWHEAKVLSGGKILRLSVIEKEKRVKTNDLSIQLQKLGKRPKQIQGIYKKIIKVGIKKI